MPVDYRVQVMADISGVIPDFEIETLLGNGAIRCEAAPETGQIQPASLDLRLGATAYRLQASFLPGKDRKVATMLEEPGIELHRLDLTQQGAVLETGCVYLVPLQEALRLPAGLSARANPKSSTGRIDVFTRLVTDRGRAFDEVPTSYSGPLYLEVSPRTFPVKVRPGDRLAQLRFKQNKPETLREKIVSIDLEPPAGQPAGYRAKPHSGVIDLKGIAAHEVSQFWEPVYPKAGRIVLNPEEFYILVSRETVKVPSGEAAEMAPIAPELGEFRAHYAGFFDPGFGTNKGGSRAVLEVRSRDVPFILEHGQPVARLIYEAMTQKPRALYGGRGSNYQGQGLKLSKHFAVAPVSG